MEGNWQGKRKAGLIEVKQHGSKPGKGGNQGMVKMEDLADSWSTGTEQHGGRLAEAGQQCT